MKADELRASILQAAIQGKLVPQNPDDEPASVLVERIRDEKHRLIKEGKIKKQKGESFIFRRDGSWFETIDGKDERCIDDEIPFDIPDNWTWARLGFITNYGNNNSCKTSEIPKDSIIIDLENIEKDTGRLLSTSAAKDSRESSRNEFHSGDVLYSKLRPYLNKVVVPDFDGYCSGEIMVLQMPKGVDPYFMQIVLMSPYFVEYANSKSYGVKMPRLGTKDGQQALIPIAPSHEQSSILEQAILLLDKVHIYNQFEMDQSQLISDFPSKMRSSVLQAAIQGKLVPQDPDDEPASVLVERIRDEKHRLIKEGKIKKQKGESFIFRRDGSWFETIDGKDEHCIDDKIPFDTPNNWTWSRIGSFFFLQSGKNRSTSLIKESSSDDFPYKCVGGNGLRGYTNTYNVDGSHVIIGRQGALCGNINLFDGTFYATEHAVVVYTFDNISPLWSAFFLKALNLNQYATATAQPGLAVSNINNVLIPIPPIQEQNRIVALFQSLDSNIKIL